MKAISERTKRTSYRCEEKAGAPTKLASHRLLSLTPYPVLPRRGRYGHAQPPSRRLSSAKWNVQQHLVRKENPQEAIRFAFDQRSTWPRHWPKPFHNRIAIDHGGRGDDRSTSL